MPDLISRPVRDSQAEMSDMMMPENANILGHVFGGVILSMMDKCAAIAAFRHARANVVTVSIDRVSFREPIHVGDLVIMRSSVNFVGRTSMEVGVRVLAEDLVTGNRRHTNSCYLTFVAIDRNGRPISVPGWCPRRPTRSAGTRRPRSAGAGASRSARRRRAGTARRLESRARTRQLPPHVANAVHRRAGQPHPPARAPHRRGHRGELPPLARAHRRVRDREHQQPPRGPRRAREELEREALAIAAEIAGYEVELAQIGVRCTDHAAGLVDFPGELDGRPVELCWRLGEPTVQYWHEIGAGFAERRLLPSRAA
jgi:acyl-CoA hydrolase